MHKHLVLKPGNRRKRCRTGERVETDRNRKMSTTEDEYNMNHVNRGTTLIINNETFSSMPKREGTKVDGELIEKQFKELKFNVEIFNNLTCKEMKNKITKVANADHNNSDCFVCVILSHGEEGAVYGTDGPLEVKELVDPFKGQKSLAGKPKLFFFQACRGKEFDDGVTCSDALAVTGDSGEGEVKEVTYTIPIEADFLIAYSVVPGYFSWRNSANGSWFIQALCAVLEKYGATLDLMTMMTRVNKIVAYEFESNAGQEFMNRKKQIPCITSMLTKDVYFRPKQ